MCVLINVSFLSPLPLPRSPRSLPHLEALSAARGAASAAAATAKAAAEGAAAVPLPQQHKGEQGRQGQEREGGQRTARGPSRLCHRARIACVSPGGEKRQGASERRRQRERKREIPQGGGGQLSTIASMQTRREAQRAQSRAEYVGERERGK